MVTKVYLWDRKYIDDIFDNKEKYIKEHPEKYLFTYDGEFEWAWYVIEVGGNYYRFCMGGTNQDPTYFVEKFNYRPEKTAMDTAHSAYCPACGYSIDWEQDDGLCRCDQCHSTVFKTTFVRGNCEYNFTADYHTELQELFKPHKLEVNKIRVGAPV